MSFCWRAPAETESSTQWLSRKFQEIFGQLGAFPGILVFEKDKSILPVLLKDALHPGLQLRLAIIRPAQTQISPISGRFERNLQLIFLFGDAQRRFMLPQQF